MMVRAYIIVQSEIVLAFKKASAPSDDLLEFNHGIYRSQEYDIPDVPCVNTGGKFLGGRQYCRNTFFIVLKIPKVLFAKLSVIGGNPVAIIGVIAFLMLVYQIPYSQGMFLIRTENEGLLFLVYFIKDNVYPLFFTFFYLNNSVKVLFTIHPALFNLALDYRIIRGIEVFIDGSLHPFYLERGEKAVVDPFFQ